MSLYVLSSGFPHAPARRGSEVSRQQKAGAVRAGAVSLTLPLRCPCFELPLSHRLLPSRAQPFLQNSLAWEVRGDACLHPISVSPGEGTLFQARVMAGRQQGGFPGERTAAPRTCSLGSAASLRAPGARGSPSPARWQGLSRSLQPTSLQTTAWPLLPGKRLEVSGLRSRGSLLPGKGWIQSTSALGSGGNRLHALGCSAGWGRRAVVSSAVW